MSNDNSCINNNTNSSHRNNSDNHFRSWTPVGNMQKERPRTKYAVVSQKRRDDATTSSVHLNYTDKGLSGKVEYFMDPRERKKDNTFCDGQFGSESFEASSVSEHEYGLTGQTVRWYEVCNEKLNPKQQASCRRTCLDCHGTSAYKRRLEMCFYEISVIPRDLPPPRKVSIRKDCSHRSRSKTRNSYKRCRKRQSSAKLRHYDSSFIDSMNIALLEIGKHVSEVVKRHLQKNPSQLCSLTKDCSQSPGQCNPSDNIQCFNCSCAAEDRLVSWPPKREFETNTESQSIAGSCIDKGQNRCNRSKVPLDESNGQAKVVQESLDYDLCHTQNCHTLSDDSNPIYDSSNNKVFTTTTTNCDDIFQKIVGRELCHTLSSSLEEGSNPINEVSNSKVLIPLCKLGGEENYEIFSHLERTVDPLKESELMIPIYGKSAVSNELSGTEEIPKPEQYHVRGEANREFWRAKSADCQNQVTDTLSAVGLPPLSDINFKDNHRGSKLGHQKQPDVSLKRSDSLECCSMKCRKLSTPFSSCSKKQLVHPKSCQTDSDEFPGCSSPLCCPQSKMQLLSRKRFCDSNPSNHKIGAKLHAPRSCTTPTEDLKPLESFVDDLLACRFKYETLKSAVGSARPCFSDFSIGNVKSDFKCLSHGRGRRGSFIFASPSIQLQHVNHNCCAEYTDARCRTIYTKPDVTEIKIHKGKQKERFSLNHCYFTSSGKLFWLGDTALKPRLRGLGQSPRHRLWNRIVNDEFLKPPWTSMTSSYSKRDSRVRFHTGENQRSSLEVPSYSASFSGKTGTPVMFCHCCSSHRPYTPRRIVDQRKQSHLTDDRPFYVQRRNVQSSTDSILLNSYEPSPRENVGVTCTSTCESQSPNCPQRKHSNTLQSCLRYPADHSLSQSLGLSTDTPFRGCYTLDTVTSAHTDCGLRSFNSVSSNNSRSPVALRRRRMRCADSSPPILGLLMRLSSRYLWALDLTVVTVFIILISWLSMKMFIPPYRYGTLVV